MGRHADACIDDKRNVGEMRPHGFERIRIVQATARADGRAPRHQHLATGLEKLFRDDQIVIHIGKDLEAVVAQRARRFHKAERVGLQCVMVADDFELDPVGAEDFPRHFCRGDSFAGRVTARRVRQNSDAQFPDQRPEILSGAGLAAFAAQRDGNDTALRGAHRIGQYGR